MEKDCIVDRSVNVNIKKLLQAQNMSLYIEQEDGWIDDLRFTSFSIVIKSYQDDVYVIERFSLLKRSLPQAGFEAGCASSARQSLTD